MRGQALDDHGVRIPGNGLVVDDQAAFFVAVVHGRDAYPRGPADRGLTGLG